MLKRRARGAKDAHVTGYVVSVDKDKVVISVDTRDRVYKKGQRIIATVRSTQKTALGRSTGILEVIAQGTIDDVSGKMITIRSKSNNPIISQKARTPNAVVNVKSMQ